MKEEAMTTVQSELIAWVIAGTMAVMGAGATFVAWVFRVFLFDRIKNLEEKLSTVEKNGMSALAAAVEGLRLEVARTGEGLRTELAATRREIKDDVAILIEAGSK